jgi:hypothetical protein
MAQRSTLGTAGATLLHRRTGAEALAAAFEFLHTATQEIQAAHQGIVAANQALVASSEAMQRAGDALTHAVAAALHSKEEHEAVRETVKRLEALVLELLARLPPRKRNDDDESTSAGRAADGVIVPLPPAFLALAGLARLEETLGRVGERLGAKARLLGVVLGAAARGAEDYAAVLTETLTRLRPRKR